MKKIFALLTISMLLLGLTAAPALADDAFTPIVLDFDDYNALDYSSVNNYISSKGWDSGSTVAAIENGKVVLNGTSLFRNWSTALFDNTQSGYEFVVEFDAAFTELTSTNTYTGYSFPLIASSVGSGSDNNRILAARAYTKQQYQVRANSSNTSSQSSTYASAVNNNEELTYTGVVKFGASGPTVSAWAADASGTLTTDDIVGLTGLASATGVRRIELSTNSGNTAKVDNIRIYAANDVFELSGGNVADNAVNVALNQTLTYTFNNPVLPFTLSGITVTKDGDAVDSSLYTVTLKKDFAGLNRIVEISFPSGMAANAEYEVTFPTTLRDTTRTALTAAVTRSFTTMALPEFSIDLDLTCGGSSITDLSDAAGKRIVCNAVATNLESEAVSAMVLVGVYDENDDLVKLCGLTKEIAAGAESSATYSFELPLDVTGYSVKAIVCANILNLTAYAETTFGD